MLLDTHKSEIETIVGRYASKRSAVLPLLYVAQDSYGHLTTEAIREVATILDLPYTDVHEVVGFYSLFYNRPMGTWVLQVCDDVPCCYLGAEELVTALKDALGIAEEQTTGDGMFTLQRVKCVAACNRAPVLQANLDYVYEVTPERVGALLESLRSRAAEARQRGVSGRFAEDFAFGADGALAQIERPSSAAQPPPAEPVADAVGAPPAEALPAEEHEQAQAEAQEQAEAESPTQLAPDGSPAGEMPKPETAENGDAVPAHAAQQEPPEERAGAAAEGDAPARPAQPDRPTENPEEPPDTTARQAPPAEEKPEQKPSQRSPL